MYRRLYGEPDHSILTYISKEGITLKSEKAKYIFIERTYLLHCKGQITCDLWLVTHVVKKIFIPALCSLDVFPSGVFSWYLERFVGQHLMEEA